MSRDDQALSGAVHLALKQDGAITRSQAVAHGLSPGHLRYLVEAGGWTSPVRGAVVVAQARDPVRAAARAAALTTPSAVVCGPTAAALHGLTAVPAERFRDLVHLVLPRGHTCTQRRGIALRWSNLLPKEIVDLGGIPVTSLERTIADLVLRANREDAVSLLDAALNTGTIRSEEVAAIRLMTRGRPGCQRAVDWFSQVDGRAESPLESRVRLVLADAGRRPEELQWVVHSEGATVARLDMAWPSRRLALEADGVAPHELPSALFRDRERQNALVALGWSVYRVTWTDVTKRSGWIVSLIPAA
jgi:hypothetical protein